MASVESAVAEFVDDMQAVSNRNGATISINGVTIASPDLASAVDADEELSPEEKAARDAERLEKLQADWRAHTEQLERDLGHAMVDLVRAKATAKGAQKEVDRVAELLDHRYAIGAPSELPKPVDGLHQKEMFDEDEDESDEDNRWKAVPIAAFKLSPAILKNLAEAGIETIGQFESHTNGGSTRITDIDGIGPKAEESILEALDAFWTAWRANADEAVATYV